MNDTRVSSKHTGFTNFIWKGKYNFFIKFRCTQTKTLMCGINKLKKKFNKTSSATAASLSSLFSTTFVLSAQPQSDAFAFRT